MTRSSQGLPTSRAYWELKAEQMLNRVFSAETSIDVEIVEPGPVVEPAAAPTAPAPGSRPRALLPLLLIAVGVGTTLLAVLVVGLWSQQQQVLRQERNLVLLERLRSLGPAAAEAPAPTSTLPPPPPSEPWMEELAQLPSDGAPPAAVLQVPLTPGLANRATIPVGPPPPVPTAASEGLPQLVGVVQSQGRGGSAIFQIGGSSTSAAIGDSIGSSGWRLQATSGDSAVIERGGRLRRLSIGSGL